MRNWRSIVEEVGVDTGDGGGASIEDVDVARLRRLPLTLLTRFSILILFLLLLLFNSRVWFDSISRSPPPSFANPTSR